ncbi:MAG: desulfoferrodoxin [Parcubacteria group bacterium]|jgi:superoxide reductase
MNKIYKCNICGNIVELLHVGGGELVCCGKPMDLLEEKTKEVEGMEKHVPIIEKTENGIKVKVGSIEHPMEEAHYIEWIEINFDGKVEKKFLHPGEKPEAEFNVSPDQIIARCYCNVHGLWKN